MSNSEKIIATAQTTSLSAASVLAKKFGLNIFAVDAGPGSRLEVWNKAWNRKLASGSHVSKYIA